MRNSPRAKGTNGPSEGSSWASGILVGVLLACCLVPALIALGVITVLKGFLVESWPAVLAGMAFGLAAWVVFWLRAGKCRKKRE